MEPLRSSRRRAVAGLTSVVCLLWLSVATQAASAAVIGFDDRPSGTTLDEQYAALGVRFGPSPFPGESGKFTAVARPGQARSGPNVAAFAYDAGADFSTSWIRFDKQQRKASFYVCRTGGAGDPPQPNVNVDAFDSSGTQIDNQQGIQCNLNGPLVPVIVETPRISFIRVAGTGGSAPPGAGWGLDNLEFETNPPPPDPGKVAPPGLCLSSSAPPGIIGTLGADRLVGTAAKDRLRGLAGDDCLAGRAGNDELDGGADDDVLHGEDGDDRLLGGSGKDTLNSGLGKDRASGQSGDDRVRGNGGNDRISGGTGSDRLTGGSGRDSLTGSSGDDRLSAGSGNDTISAGSGRDRVTGGSGDDRITARDGQRDTIKCGTGRDRVSADRRDSVSRDCERVSRARR